MPSRFKSFSHSKSSIQPLFQILKCALDSLLPTLSIWGLFKTAGRLTSLVSFTACRQPRADRFGDVFGAGCRTLPGASPSPEQELILAVLHEFFALQCGVWCRKTFPWTSLTNNLPCRRSQNTKLLWALGRYSRAQTRKRSGKLFFCQTKKFRTSFSSSKCKQYCTGLGALIEPKFGWPLRPYGLRNQSFVMRIRFSNHFYPWIRILVKSAMNMADLGRRSSTDDVKRSCPSIHFSRTRIVKNALRSTSGFVV